MPVSRIFFYISPGVPSKGAPFSIVPQGCCYGERCSVSRVNGLIFHSYLSESPVKKLTQNVGEHMVAVHAAACSWKVYIQWVVAWCPKGFIYDTAVTTSVPCSLLHNSFHLGLGRQEPCSQCVIVTLYGVSLPHLLAPPMWPRVQIST